MGQMSKPGHPYISGAPQIYDRTTTSTIIWHVVLCLLPAAGWGMYIFGINAVRIVFTAVFTAVAVEGAIGLLLKRFTLYDGSAFLSGLLIGMMLPPTVPLYIPILASLFAMAVVKGSFGGLGRNWMNPALAGWAFVYLSFSDQMHQWVYPGMVREVDAMTRATPLRLVKTSILLGRAEGSSPMEILSSAGFPRSLMDGAWTTWLNSHILEPLGISLPPGYIDLFFGFIPGAIGETSALLLLIGTVVLIGKKILPWEVPVSFFTVFCGLTAVFGGLPFGGGWVAGDVLFQLFSGGILLGVFYMATDLVTSPLTRMGLVIYGMGIGLLTFLIRLYGGYAEGIGFSILFMNVFVPLINKCATSGSRVEKKPI